MSGPLKSTLPREWSLVSGRWFEDALIGVEEIAGLSSLGVRCQGSGAVCSAGTVGGAEPVA